MQVKQSPQQQIQENGGGNDCRTCRTSGVRRFRVATVFLLLILMPVIWVLGLALNMGRALQAYPQPQALFVLGGNLARVHYAMRKAADFPHLHLVISSGITDGAARNLAEQAGITPDRLWVDHQAVDTLTNFTRMLYPLRQQGIRHVYLVTSDYHMRRSRVVAGLVFGSRGIAVSPLPVASRRRPETRGHALRDGLRALLWLISGWDGQIDASRLTQKD